MTTAHDRYRIVLVDDVPEIREILSFLLEDSGWFTVVGHAGNADDAIAVVERERPDLLLLDVELEGRLSGWQVLSELAPRVPEMRTVILSGSMDDAAPPPPEQRALARAVLPKGITSRELTSALLDVLGHTREPAAPTPGRVPTAPHLAADAVGDAWLAAIVNSSPDAVIGEQLDGTIVSWNYAAEQLYGYATDEAVGRNISMLVPSDQPDELPWIWSRIGAGGVVQDLETRRICKDGSTLDVVITTSPVVEPSGRVIGAATVARDVSRRRTVETTLSRAIAQLERKNRELLRSNEELDSFAAVASHDLAQPLQVAYGFVDMVRNAYGERLDDDGRAWLEHALRGLERLRSLVRDILQYSRAGSGEPAHEPIDLDQVVRGAVADLQVAIDERDAAVDVGELPPVVGDRSQLRLVFQNLLANALKFVPPGRTPKVWIVAAPAGDDVVVDVTDNGVGIPRGARSQVFEMFQRAAGKEFEGSGVGLAIVKKIVGRHGGSIWVESGVDGVGTRMRVQLPAPRGTGQ